MQQQNAQIKSRGVGFIYETGTLRAGMPSPQAIAHPSAHNQILPNSIFSSKTNANE